MTTKGKVNSLLTSLGSDDHKTRQAGAVPANGGVAVGEETPPRSLPPTSSTPKRRPGERQINAGIPPDLYKAFADFCYLANPRIRQKDALIEAISDYLEKHKQTT